VESLGCRKKVVVLGLAANMVKGLDKSCSAIKSIIGLVISRIAVIVATASALAIIRSLARLPAFVEALTSDVALTGADVSAHDIHVIRNSSFSSKGNDLVDLHAEHELILQSLTILLLAAPLVTHASNGQRNILLTNTDGFLLKTTVTSLTKKVRRLLGNAEELLHCHLLNVSITVLAWLGGVLSELPSIRIELVKGDGSRALIIHSSDPATRPARSDESAKSVIVPASVSRVISGSRGGNVHIVRDVLLVEEGSRVASLNENDPVLIELLLLKELEDGGDIFTSEVTTFGHANDISVAVIIIVEEDIVLLGGLEGLATSTRGSHASENCDKVISGSVFASVILGNTLINVDVMTILDVEIVVNCTGERILA